MRHIHFDNIYRELQLEGLVRQDSLEHWQLSIMHFLSVATDGVCYCQDAGLHPLRQAAKKERMIDEHRSWCAEQYILCRPSRTRLCLTCARTSYPHEASPHVRAYALQL
jgi:hypothetical protein